MAAGAEAMALWPEVTVDDGVRREEKCSPTSRLLTKISPACSLESEPESAPMRSRGSPSPRNEAHPSLFNPIR
jgi:hypothetical protein